MFASALFLFCRMDQFNDGTRRRCSRIQPRCKGHLFQSLAMECEVPQLKLYKEITLTDKNEIILQVSLSSLKILLTVILFHNKPNTLHVNNIRENMCKFYLRDA